MNELVVFSSKGCSGCKAVILELDRRNVRHKVVKIDEDADGMLAFKALGHRSVPQVYTDEMELLASDLMGLLKLPQGTLDKFKNA